MSNKHLSPEEDQLYEFIFRQAVEGMLLIDEKGTILKANPACLSIFGYQQEDELLGNSVEMLIPQRLRGQHISYRQAFHEQPKARSMGHGRELAGVNKAGKEFFVEISLSPIKRGHQQMVLAHIIDITTRKRLQESFLEREALLDSIIEHAVDGIITIDERGKVESLNPAAAHLFGYEPEEVIGQNIRTLMPEPYHSEHDQYLKNYRDTGIKKIIGIGREVKGKRKDGSVFPFRLSISEVKLKDRRIFTGIVHDITSMKEAEEKLREYAKELERSNRELEDFAYVSSHDLQEPLRKIQAFGNWLQEKESEKFSPKGHDYLKRMLNAASRLQRLINDLLTYSRVSSKAKPFEKVNLNHTLETVLSDLELLIQQKNAVIISDPLPEIIADYTQMRQLFQNLISNSIKFTKDDESPRIEIKCRTTILQPTANQPVEGIELKFSDNGIGFDPKYKEKIFTIFQRLEGQKYQGSGIGLSIVQRIVRRHKGEVEVESQLGMGTTFTIQLPTLQKDINQSV